MITSRPLLLVAAIAVAVASGGCSDAFTPTVGGEAVAAVAGTLDGTERTQRLRIQDVRAPIGRPEDTPAPTVVSSELGSGLITAWRDSVITLADGTRDRLYLADLAVGLGERHQIVVTRDDGAEARVTVPIPDLTLAVTSVDPDASFRVDFAVNGLEGEVAASPIVRYRIRRSNGTGEQDLIASAPLDRRETPVTSLAVLGVARTQGAQILYGTGPGDVVLVDVRLETMLRSGSPVPVERGVGGVQWEVPVSVALPIPSAVVTQAGFVDERP